MLACDYYRGEDAVIVGTSNSIESSVSSPGSIKHLHNVANHFFADLYLSLIKRIVQDSLFAVEY